MDESKEVFVWGVFCDEEYTGVWLDSAFASEDDAEAAAEKLNGTRSGGTIRDWPYVVYPIEVHQTFAEWLDSQEG